MYERYMKFMECVDSLDRFAVLNKSQGTVTIPFRSFYQLRHDSTVLSLLKNGICEVEDIMEKERNFDFLGSTFASIHIPILDIDAISYVYGVPVETIEKYLKGELDGQ